MKLVEALKLVEEYAGVGSLRWRDRTIGTIPYRISRFQGMAMSGLPIPGLHRIEGTVDARERARRRGARRRQRHARARGRPHAGADGRRRARPRARRGSRAAARLRLLLTDDPCASATPISPPTSRAFATCARPCSSTSSACRASSSSTTATALCRHVLAFDGDAAVGTGPTRSRLRRQGRPRRRRRDASAQRRRRSDHAAPTRDRARAAPAAALVQRAAHGRAVLRAASATAAPGRRSSKPASTTCAWNTTLGAGVTVSVQPP